MKTYTFRVSYTFEGEVEVRAENRERAKEIIEKDFGAVSPEYHTSSSSDHPEDEGIVDWNMGIHPERHCIR
jgi:hypothetical protein